MGVELSCVLSGMSAGVCFALSTIRLTNHTGTE